MAGTKRAATDSGVTTRSSKAAKTGKATSPRTAPKKGGKRGPKTSVTASAFKSKALPLHINITHTPPAITEEGDGKVTSTAADPGHITSASLLPAVFSTGSYGWKGNQRVTVEVDNEKGEKEKLQVQISINATVLGSKQVEGDAEGEKEEKKEDADNGDAAEEKAASGAEADE